jgi:hypothetical protein
LKPGENERRETKASLEPLDQSFLQFVAGLPNRLLAEATTKLEFAERLV